MAVTRNGRANETRSFESYLSMERHRIYDRASKERKEQMMAAERAREVYRAWNEVLADSEAGKHVTGLKYLPATNELLVYFDASVWTVEVQPMRAILRTRMENTGVNVDRIKFRTSPAGYKPKRKTSLAKPPAQPSVPSSVLPELSVEDAQKIEYETQGIADKKLKEALQNAMKAGARLSAAKRAGK